MSLGQLAHESALVSPPRQLPPPTVGSRVVRASGAFGLTLLLLVLLLATQRLIRVESQTDEGVASPPVRAPSVAEKIPAGGPASPAAATFSLELAWVNNTESLAVAWGDVDNDGDLDLAVGEESAALYLNRPQGFMSTADWLASTSDRPQDLAWGDVDNDGDLDLASVVSGTDHLFTNSGGSLDPTPSWFSTLSDMTTSAAWGDVNGDGLLDLAAGADGVKVYMNSGGSLATSPNWISVDPTPVTDLAWGDMDSDGDLDLAVAVAAWPSPRVYRNQNGSLEPIHAWDGASEASRVAWVDIEGDGDLDLAATGVNGFDMGVLIFANSGSGLTAPPSQAVQSSAISMDWGDADGDGDLDLATGAAMLLPRCPSNEITLNDAGTMQDTGAWADGVCDLTNNLAWGDWDGDGDLDLAMAGRTGSRLYLNRSPVFHYHKTIPSGTGGIYYAFKDLAWGDVDGDDDLDLAAGSGLYLNQGGDIQATPIWTSTELLYSLAWGDADADGDLDLAAGSNSGARLFLNLGSSLAAGPDWSVDFPVDMATVAWGDMDGDGDLDLVVGVRRYVQPELSFNRIYYNENGQLSLTPGWISAETDMTVGLALGDMDGDGDLDLVAGNQGANRLYYNHGGQLESAATWSDQDHDYTGDIALGDVDGDGDLDLISGNQWSPNRMYTNVNGALDVTASWSSGDFFRTLDVALGDVDGDGDLDLITANGEVDTSVPNRLYLNEGGELQTGNDDPETFAGGDTYSVALADMDRDGDLDLAFGNDPAYAVYPPIIDLDLYLNQHGASQPVVGQRPAAASISLFSEPVQTYNQSVTALAPADQHAVTAIRSDGTIPITFTLSDPADQPIRLLRAFYSLDGGGQWHPAAAGAPVSHPLAADSQGGTSHVFAWDLFGSGFFGQSDDVVIRLEASPGSHPADGVPGPYQRPFVSAQTYPFRARGTQVRVMSGTVPAENALVFHIPAGQLQGAPLADSAGRPFRTTHLGYLQGRGELEVGDQLVALLPITSTEAYTLYFTSASPTADGLEMYTVSASGVQTLMVSSLNPLVLFNLELSLQWDARSDPAFLTQLEYDLNRASEFLYDWSNGQAALGSLDVFHARSLWEEADIRIHASNRLRPNATKGGIVAQPTTDPVVPSYTYRPGQVRIGASWNRYGAPGGSLGQDWPRALAHELGHYALYLDDNYLGFALDGYLIPVDSCPGAMADPYREDYPYGEYHPLNENWTSDCFDTLSQQTTGRADWQTITTFYPWLTSPDPITNTGPSTLPIAVTQIDFQEPVTPSTALSDPTFYLRLDDARVEPDPRARAFLFQDDWLIDLGRPTIDRILARGAQPGDRLCLYELGRGTEERLGCREVQIGAQVLELHDATGWQPDVIVSPVSSRTIPIQVTGIPSGLSLHGRLYPFNDPAAPPIALSELGDTYSGTFSLTEPAVAGYVVVWVEEPDPRREIVTDFAMGGNPGPADMGWGAPTPVASSVQRRMPAMSPDGQVLLFGDFEFQQGAFFALQTATNIPSPPPWATLVGQAYRLIASQDAPSLESASINFQYLTMEVPPGEETWLRVYRWNESSGAWEKLDTVLDTHYNSASAHAPGTGLYALMSSLEIPLASAGWNLFSYPVEATRPVSQALLSISGYYTTVYGFEAADTADPWKVYDVTAPWWVNDLEALEFGKGYWINISEPITLHLQGASSSMAMAAIAPPVPATYYGSVSGGSGLTPTAGMTLTAWANSSVCAKDTLQDVPGYGLAYAMDLPQSCAPPGQAVLFRLGSIPLAPVPIVVSGQVLQVNLEPFGHTLYLPVALGPLWDWFP